MHDPFMAMSSGPGLLGPVAVSSSDEAYVAIRRAILDGSLRPGERIIEQRLAQQLNVSRTPVREALHKLERENLVSRSGRGMAVQSFSAEEVSDIYELRAQLESYAARRAAERITRPQLDELRRVQDLLMVEAERDGLSEDMDRLRTLARFNQQFHLLVVRAAQSEPLERVISGVGQTPLVYKAYLWYGDDEKVRSAEDHNHLIRLLSDGDAAAAEAVWRGHIEFGRGVLVDRLNAQLSPDAGF
jgi:DNA-binding GntR family transcriptional regulator